MVVIKICDHCYAHMNNDEAAVEVEVIPFTDYDDLRLIQQFDFCSYKCASEWLSSVNKIEDIRKTEIRVYAEPYEQGGDDDEAVMVGKSN